MEVFDSEIVYYEDNPHKFQALCVHEEVYVGSLPFVP
jgi:hypothetical protein